MTTSAIRVGVADDAITNFHPFSEELEGSIYVSPKIINDPLFYGSNWGFVRNFNHSSGLPVPEGMTSSILTSSVEAFHTNYGCLENRYSTTDRLTGLFSTSPEISPRKLPVINSTVLFGNSKSEKNALRVMAVFNNWKNYKMFHPLVRTSSSVRRFVFSQNGSAKLVNIYTNAKTRVTTYSFVTKGPGSYLSGEEVPILVNVFVHHDEAPSSTPSFLRSKHVLPSSFEAERLPEYRIVNPVLLDGLLIPFINRTLQGTGIFINPYGEMFVRAHSTFNSSADVIPIQKDFITYLDFGKIAQENSITMNGPMSMAELINSLRPFPAYANFENLGLVLNPTGFWTNPDNFRDTSETDPIKKAFVRMVRSLMTVAWFREKPSLVHRGVVTETVRKHISKIVQIEGHTENRLQDYVKELVKVKKQELNPEPNGSVSLKALRFVFQGPESPKGQALSEVATALKKAALSKELEASL